MKPFDKKLADNMRNVFDNWQEPVDENAWLQIKQKLGGKSNKTALFFIWTWPVKVAATILLGLLTFSVWYYQDNLRETDLLTSQNDNQVKNTGTSGSGEESFQEPIPENDNENIAIVDETAATENGTQNRLLLIAEYVEETDQTSTKQTDTEADLPERDLTPGNVVESLLPADHLAEEVIPTITAEGDGALNEIEDHLAVTILSEVDSLYDLNTSDTAIAVSPVVVAKSNDELTIAANLLEMNAEKQNRTSNSYVEISAGSLKTYSSAELASGLGFSAGVMGYWAVGKNVSLSSGGVLMYNQFTLDNPMAASGSRNLDESVAMPSFDYSSSANTLYAVTSNYTDFEFTAIDIPLNVRFKVADRPRSQFFVSGGLSSLLYLQQNYTRYTEYATMSNQFGLSGSQEVVSGTTSFSDGDSYEAFRQFDFGRLINFSMGYLIKRERHSILIEPHIKYPVGNITSMDLRIGMAGISLKYNFLEQ